MDRSLLATEYLAPSLELVPNSGSAQSDILHGDILCALHLPEKGWDSGAMPVEWQVSDGQPQVDYTLALGTDL